MSQVLPVKLEVADNTGKAKRCQGTIVLQNPTGLSVAWSYSRLDVSPRLHLVPATGVRECFFLEYAHARLRQEMQLVHAASAKHSTTLFSVSPLSRCVHVTECHRLILECVTQAPERCLCMAAVHLPVSV